MMKRRGSGRSVAGEYLGLRNSSLRPAQADAANIEES
jgi:hypothetical protein